MERAQTQATVFNMQGVAMLSLAVVATGLFFEEGILLLLEVWQLAEYSHGPLIPILSGFMFLRQLKDVPADPAPVTDRWPGVLVVAVSLLLGLAGKVAGVPDVVAYALILWVGGVVLVTFGWKRGLQFWPPVLHLAFMLPLPGILYWKLSTMLQFISSEFGVWLVRLAGVPVFLDGNIIDLGVYKLHVAEACSGLRYLFPILPFSYVFAVLYQGPMWHKAVLLISAAPITVVMNSVRIGIIGIMVDSFGLEHAEGFSHFMEGWVIFIACVLILFGLAWVMLKIQRAQMSLPEALDLDTSGLGPQMARIGLVMPSAGMIATTVLCMAAAVMWYGAPERTRVVIDREPLSVFPRELGEWRAGSPSYLAPAIEDALGADEYISLSYAAPARPNVELFIAHYHDQSGGGIHSPEVCLPGGGWEMADIRREDISEKIGAEGPFNVNRAVIQKGYSRMMVYYWFEQHGRRIAWDFAAKAYLLWDGLLYDRRDGALMRLITPIAEGETDDQAEARLVSLLKEKLPHIERFSPSAF